MPDEHEGGMIHDDEDFGKQLARREAIVAKKILARFDSEVGDCPSAQMHNVICVQGYTGGADYQCTHCGAMMTIGSGEMWSWYEGGL